MVDASGSDYGYDQFIKVSIAMAHTALEVMADPELSKEAWDDHTVWMEKHAT